MSEKLTAEEALRYNLVARVYESKEEMDRILWPKIQEYSELPTGSLMATKRLIKKNFPLDMMMKISDEEVRVLATRMQSGEVREAAKRFLSRKKSKL